MFVEFRIYIYIYIYVCIYIYIYIYQDIKTEAVFTKTVMNNERNVNLLQNTRCVEKLSDWSCIYQDSTEQWRKL